MAAKKSKRREQHRKAVAEFLEWQKAHPRATHQETFDAFDRFVDSIDILELTEKISEYAPTS